MVYHQIWLEKFTESGLGHMSEKNPPIEFISQSKSVPMLVDLKFKNFVTDVNGADLI
jgi:hypothetical protein